MQDRINYLAKGFPRRRSRHRELRSLCPHHNGSVRGKVVGYWHEGNPSARVGETEGGHDFAVTEDRFLVDPWLYHHYSGPPVLDLTEPAGQAKAAARYGPEANWKLLPSREEMVKELHEKSRCRWER